MQENYMQENLMQIINQLAQTHPTPHPLRAQEAVTLLERAKTEMKGLTLEEVAGLMEIDDPMLLEKLFETAESIKDQIYGNRLVLFAPLYISNTCNNECLYCAFRHQNKDLQRKTLNSQQIVAETEALIDQGHKRVLLVCGEDNTLDEFAYVCKSIKDVYSVQSPKGNIRRLNVNIAPLSVENFKILFQQEIGTYQCFQETYHPETYNQVHVGGKKQNFQWRLEVMDRAFQGGGHDLGLGVLFGLYDWKFEVLALLAHIAHLEKNYGVGPHTISVPRIEEAHGSSYSLNPAYAVSDGDFLKIIAILRIAVPYTGLILSTRERPDIRRRAFSLGVSQISAGSKTDPGGYSHLGGKKSSTPAEQFSLGDSRPLSEVIEDIVDCGYMPSFCTACYRSQRIGKDFMDYAKPGLIKMHCLPNSVFTFAEYLHDFGSSKLKDKGFKFIQRKIEEEIPDPNYRKRIEANLARIQEGTRDIFV